MHHAVGTNVEWFVEQVPHHRHIALRHLENMAVRSGHRDVDACREQYATAPGVRRETHTVSRGQCCDASDLGHTACAGNIRLRYIQSAALEQILKVEPGELSLARGDG